MPVEGGFYGDGVAGTLEYDVQISNSYAWATIFRER